MDALVRRRGNPNPELIELLDITHSAGDRTVETSEEFIPGEELWGFNVRNATSPLKRGQAYCVVGLVPPQGGSTTIKLASGYVYDENNVSLGEFAEPGPGGGEGFIRRITGTDPGANTEVIETVPTNALWRPRSFSVVLVTDATGHNHVPRLAIDVGTATNRLWIAPDDAANPVIENETRTLHWNSGTTNGSNAQVIEITDTEIVNPRGIVPSDLLLPEGYRIRTVTDGLAGTDNYEAPIFMVEEWIVL